VRSRLIARSTETRHRLGPLHEVRLTAGPRCDGHASPGCSDRPRLFIEFHLTRERIGRLSGRKAPMVDYEKTSGIALCRMIFSAFRDGFPPRRPDSFFRPSSSCIGIFGGFLLMAGFALRCCIFA
jgi:hypothetical protein